MKENQTFITLRSKTSLHLLNESDISKLNQRHKDILRSSLERIKKSAQNKTPVKTGRLRKGYRINVVGTYPNTQANISNVQPYFSTIEYGRPRFKEHVGYVRIRPNVPLSDQDRIGGVKMLQRSIKKNQGELDNMENEFINDYLSLLKIKK